MIAAIGFALWALCQFAFRVILIEIDVFRYSLYRRAFKAIETCALLIMALSLALWLWRVAP
jgi:hypothetical protein